jgi:nicotinamidase-related amidase
VRLFDTERIKTMSASQTLLELAGTAYPPARLRDACLVLIDMQNEYCSGPVAAADADSAIDAARQLLSAARSCGAPVFHVVHKGRPGMLFDRAAERGQIIPVLAPLPGEVVIEKPFPNSFAGTDLHDRLSAIGRKNLILAGFATHMCISSTARAAVEHGYRATVAADACAARDLPDGRGGVVPASTVHHVALVELSDRFAAIARDHRHLI